MQQSTRFIFAMALCLALTIFGAGWFWLDPLSRPGTAPSGPKASAVAPKQSVDATRWPTPERDRRSAQREPTPDAQSEAKSTGQDLADSSTSIRLFVEDRATGAQLNAVQLIPIYPPGLRPGQHPSVRDPRASGILSQASPLELTEELLSKLRSATACLIGSPGYAWVTLGVDLSQGGERRVQLEPGGDLRLFFEGEPNWNQATLQLRKPESMLSIMELEVVGKGPLVLKGLPLGPLELSVELGNWWNQPIVLASASTLIEVAREQTVTLTLASGPNLEMAPLFGRLRLPAAWGFEEFSLKIELMDAPLGGSPANYILSEQDFSQVADLREVFAFDLGRVQAGRYEFEFVPLHQKFAFDVTTNQQLPIELEIPAPLQVRVTVGDEQGGTAPALQQISWAPVALQQVMSQPYNSADYDPESAGFSLRVPDCKITINAGGGFSNYSRVESTLHPLDGQELNLLLRRATAGLIRLRDGKLCIPWPGSTTFQVDQINGDGTKIVWGNRDNGMWFAVNRPGLYRINVPVPAGYQQAQPLEVLLRAGEITEIDLELDPER